MFVLKVQYDYDRGESVLVGKDGYYLMIFGIKLFMKSYELGSYGLELIETFRKAPDKDNLEVLFDELNDYIHEAYAIRYYLEEVEYTEDIGDIKGFALELLVMDILEG